MGLSRSHPLVRRQVGPAPDAETDVGARCPQVLPASAGTLAAVPFHDVLVNAQPSIAGEWCPGPRTSSGANATATPALVGTAGDPTANPNGLDASECDALHDAETVLTANPRVRLQGCIAFSGTTQGSPLRWVCSNGAAYSNTMPGTVNPNDPNAGPVLGSGGVNGAAVTLTRDMATCDQQCPVNNRTVLIRSDAGGVPRAKAFLHGCLSMASRNSQPVCSWAFFPSPTNAPTSDVISGSSIRALLGCGPVPANLTQAVRLLDNPSVGGGKVPTPNPTNPGGTRPDQQQGSGSGLTGPAIASIAAGTMFALIGLLACLLRRRKSKRLLKMPKKAYSPAASPTPSHRHSPSTPRPSPPRPSKTSPGKASPGPSPRPVGAPSTSVRRPTASVIRNSLPPPPAARPGSVRDDPLLLSPLGSADNNGPSLGERPTKVRFSPVLATEAPPPGSSTVSSQSASTPTKAAAIATAGALATAAAAAAQKRDSFPKRTSSSGRPLSQMAAAVAGNASSKGDGANLTSPPHTPGGLLQKASNAVHDVTTNAQKLIAVGPEQPPLPKPSAMKKGTSKSSTQNPSSSSSTALGAAAALAIPALGAAELGATKKAGGSQASTVAPSSLPSVAPPAGGGATSVLPKSKAESTSLNTPNADGPNALGQQASSQMPNKSSESSRPGQATASAGQVLNGDNAAVPIMPSRADNAQPSAKQGKLPEPIPSASDSPPPPTTPSTSDPNGAAPNSAGSSSDSPPVPTSPRLHNAPPGVQATLLRDLPSLAASAQTPTEPEGSITPELRQAHVSRLALEWMQLYATLEQHPLPAYFKSVGSNPNDPFGKVAVLSMATKRMTNYLQGYVPEPVNADESAIFGTAQSILAQLLKWSPLASIYMPVPTPVVGQPTYVRPQLMHPTFTVNAPDMVHEEPDSPTTDYAINPRLCIHTPLFPGLFDAGMGQVLVKAPIAAAVMPDRTVGICPSQMVPAHIPTAETPSVTSDSESIKSSS